MTDFKDRMADYVPVNERIEAFYKAHPFGSIQSEIVELTDSRVTVKAYAYRAPDDGHPGTGHSSLDIPGATPYTRGSEIENSETSAWGRAIAALGFEVKRGVASREEVANKQPERGEQVPAAGRRAGAPPAAPSPAQYRRGELAELLREKDMHIAQLERFADLVGIPKGSRATNIQMDDLIDAVRGHGITQPEPVRAHAGSGVGPATVGRGGDGSSDLPAALDTPHAAGTAAATVSAELGTQPAPAPSMDDILAVSGGVDVTPGVVWTTTLTETDSTTNVAPPPPKPGTPEYVALPAPAKASARAYWQRQAEPTPEPSEQMRAALVQS